MTIAKPMSTVQYVAMLSALNMTGMKERVLSKFLKQHIGKGFCPTQRGMLILVRDIPVSTLAAFSGCTKGKKGRRLWSGTKRIFTWRLRYNSQEY